MQSVLLEAQRSSIVCNGRETSANKYLRFHIVHQLTDLGVSSDEFFELSKKILYDDRTYDKLLECEHKDPHFKLCDNEGRTHVRNSKDPILMQTMPSTIFKIIDAMLAKKS